MTERKKISLRPAEAEPDADTQPRRRPPVRGSGTAPRPRRTAEDAARAAEERAQRPAPGPDEAPRWRQDGPVREHGRRDGAGRGDDRGHAGGHARHDRQDRRGDHPGQRQGDRRDGGWDHRERGPQSRPQNRPMDRHMDRRDQPRDGGRDGGRDGWRDSSRDDRYARGQDGDRWGTGRDDRDHRGPRTESRPDGQRWGERDHRAEPRRGHGQDRPQDRQHDRPHGRPGERHGDRHDAMQRPRRDDRRATGHTPRPAAPAPVAPREDDGRLRLSKLMSEQGLASRREADEWIEQGWVRVDGEVVDELGTRVFPHQHISIDPMARTQQAQRVTILLHKPIGYVSGQAEDGYEPAVALITADNRWPDDKLPLQLTRGHLRNLAPAGRLDIDSTGLLVLTQDGRVAKQLIGEDSGVEKEYLVRVQWMAQPDAENVSQLVPEEAINLMRHGLELDGRPLKHAQVSWQNEQQLRVVLREGRKRQIRRMCELVGLKVVGLKRVRMGRVTLSKLPQGQWRFLRPDEQF